MSTKETATPANTATTSSSRRTPYTAAAAFDHASTAKTAAYAATAAAAYTYATGKNPTPSTHNPSSNPNKSVAKKVKNPEKAAKKSKQPPAGKTMSTGETIRRQFDQARSFRHLKDQWIKDSVWVEILRKYFPRSKVVPTKATFNSAISRDARFAFIDDLKTSNMHKLYKKEANRVRIYYSASNDDPPKDPGPFRNWVLSDTPPEPLSKRRNEECQNKDDPDKKRKTENEQPTPPSHSSTTADASTTVDTADTSITTKSSTPYAAVAALAHATNAKSAAYAATAARAYAYATGKEPTESIQNPFSSGPNKSVAKKAKNPEKAAKKSKPPPATKKAAWEILIQSYWDQKEATKMFGSKGNTESGDELLKLMKERMRKLSRAYLIPEGYKGIIHDHDSAGLMTEEDIVTIRKKAQYLCNALKYAVDNMDKVDWTWLKCCSVAKEKIDEKYDIGEESAGSQKIKCEKTIGRYLSDWKKNEECFINPKAPKDGSTTPDVDTAKKKKKKKRAQKNKCKTDVDEQATLFPDPEPWEIVLQSYWDQKEATKLFGSKERKESGDELLDLMRERIKRLTEVNNSRGGYRPIIHDQDSDDWMTKNDKHVIRDKAKCLCDALTYALDNMDKGNCTWSTCCKHAIEKFNAKEDTGRKTTKGVKVISSTTISHWFTQWKKGDEYFINPAVDRKNKVDNKNKKQSKSKDDVITEEKQLECEDDLVIGDKV